MKLWFMKPKIDELKARGDIAGLVAAYDSGDAEMCNRVIGALVAIMRKWGHSSCAESNENAAKALLQLGAWKELLAFYDEYKPPEHDRRARGLFVLLLTRLLGEHAALTGNLPLAKHLLLTTEFGFEQLGSSMWGPSPLLKTLVEALERGSAAGDLGEIWQKAPDVDARKLARAALANMDALQAATSAAVEAGGAEQAIEDFLTQVGSTQSRIEFSALAAMVEAQDQQVMALVKQVADHGIRGTLVRMNRRETLDRFESQFKNERGIVDRMEVDRSDQNIRKSLSRLLRKRKLPG